MLVARAIAAAGAHCRIVALTATPARDSAGVQAVIDNLMIARLEVKSEQDFDIQPYVHTKFTEKVVLKLTPALERIMERIDMELAKHLGMLCHAHAFYSTDPNVATPFALRTQFAAWMEQQNAAGPSAKRSAGLMFMTAHMAQIWAQMRSLLRVHGLGPLLQHCEELRATQGNKSVHKLVASAPFGQVYGLTKKSIEAGDKHPKLREVERLLAEHFRDNAADSRVIIFTTLRASVDSIIEQGQRLACDLFVCFFLPFPCCSFAAPTGSLLAIRGPGRQQRRQGSRCGPKAKGAARCH